MAEQKDQSEKTQEPTPKKLEDSQKKGDVPSSRETGNMMVILSLLGIVTFLLPVLTGPLLFSLANVIEMSGQYQVGRDQAGLVKLGAFLVEFVLTMGYYLGAFLAVLAIGAIAGILMQGRVVVTTQRIQPKPSKISPMQGFKRLFSLNAFVEFLKNMIKVIVVGTIAVWISYGAVQEVLQGSGMMLEGLPIFLKNKVADLLIAVSIFIIPIALIDTLWQRFQWHKKQMMTQQEVRDEIKNSEGDPLIRAKRAAIRRERAQVRLVHILPKASVVITNPTHFAVALKYDRNVDVAPICIAKGVDAVAARMRALASENDVPIIENKLVARALYRAVEVDEFIPVEHWKIVAEIIGYIEGLQANIYRTPPDGSQLRIENPSDPESA